MGSFLPHSHRNSFSALFSFFIPPRGLTPAAGYFFPSNFPVDDVFSVFFKKTCFSAKISGFHASNYQRIVFDDALVSPATKGAPYGIKHVQTIGYLSYSFKKTIEKKLFSSLTFVFCHGTLTPVKRTPLALFFGIRKKKLIPCSNREKARNNMKQNRFKTLWGVALGLVLLAAAPFTAFAQADAKTDAVPKTESKEAAAQKADKKTPSEQKAEAKEAAENKEITLDIEGKIYGGMFIFEGKTIRFSNMIFYDLPEEITIDGKPWEDIRKPFELDYTPDFAKVGILERDGGRTFFVDPTEKRFTLRIENTTPGNHIAPFKVKLAMKNQLPHDNLPDFQPVFGNRNQHARQFAGTTAFIGSTMPSGQNPKNMLWKEGLNERKIILDCRIQGCGTFIFEGNKISYKHERGKEPQWVNINGRLWTFLSEPFELPFQIDTVHPKMAKTNGENPVKLLKINDQRFEVYFNDSRQPSGTHSATYTVTITPGKEPKTK